jgi:SAM-dependent methyltransferase
MECLSFVLLSTLLSRNEQVISNRVQKIQEHAESIRLDKARALAGATYDTRSERRIPIKHDVGDEDCPVAYSRTITRRQWILGFPISIVGGAGVTEAAQGLEDAEECQNGALVAGEIIAVHFVLSALVSSPPLCWCCFTFTESVVPGAYDQICMNLQIRSIPFQVPTSHRAVSQTQFLSIQQGGVGPGKTGLAVWNSALLLGRLLEAITVETPTWLHGKRVAEIGCGAGLVSLMTAHWGAQSVWATDGNPAAVALARANFDSNGIQYATTISSNTGSQNMVTDLLWGELQVPLEWMGAVDVVMGSDLTYNSGSWRVLAETMESLISRHGIVIYLSLGHSGFNVQGEMDGFVDVAKQLGLSVFPSNSLPFSLPKGVVSLDALLHSVILPGEQSILAATGGAQVVVLGRKDKQSAGLAQLPKEGYA